MKSLPLTVSTVSALGFASAAFAGPAVATRYTEPGRLTNPQITQEACLAQAEAAIVATGFGNIERTQQTGYGMQREYTAAIRCILDKQIVLIIVSCPSRQTSDEGAGARFQNFEKAK